MQLLRSRQIAAMLGINLTCDKQEKAGEVWDEYLALIHRDLKEYIESYT